MVSAAKRSNGQRPEDAANDPWCLVDIKGGAYSALSFYSWSGLNLRGITASDDPYVGDDEPGERCEKGAYAFWTLQQSWSFLEAMREITLNYTHSEISAYNRDAYAFGGNLQAEALKVKDASELPKVNFAEAAEDIISGKTSFHVQGKVIPQGAGAQVLTLNPVEVGMFNFGQAANEMTTANSGAANNTAALYHNGPQPPQYKPAAGL